MMKQRCFNPSNNKYRNYGARGITICDEWLDFNVFEEWALANGYDEVLTIDRIDTNGNYEPNNCRWVDQQTQQNNRRNNVTFNVGGKDYTLNELSDKYKMNRATIMQRIGNGMSIEEALSVGLNYDHHAIEIDGRTKNLKQWCKELGMPYKTVHVRIKRGWSINEALTKPIRQGNYK